MAGEVWEYVNPDLPADEVKSLVKPVRTTLVAVISEQQPVGGTFLSRADYIKLRFSEVQFSYSCDQTDYERRLKAINSLHLEILRTIRIELYPYTYDCTTVHEKLVRLKQRCQPTIRFRSRT